VPLPTARPAQQQQAAAPAQKTVGEAPGRGFLNAMRQAFAPQPGGGLGDAMIAGMGPRGALMSTFTDPTTRQQYLQGGSGEEAMGVLRPIGQAAARAAPAPQRPAPTSPPDQRGAASVNPPREPVPLPMARPVLQDNPFDQSGYAPDRPAGSPDNPFDVPLSPSGVPVAETPLAPFDVKQFMAGNRAPAPTGTALVGPFPRAPEAAGLLAAPAQTASPRQRPSVNPEPAPFSWPTTEVPPVNPPYAPTTTGQQMGGLSPFGTTAPQSGFASMSLLPFEQWPPIGWGWAGPSSFDFGAWG
jgi:hypothetical protein